MARKVKCNSCLLMDESINMIKNDKGKYFHKGACYEKHLKEVEFKRAEREKKDSLAIKIANIHGLDSYKFIPSTFYPYIEDLRNDSELFGKLRKNYKNGLPYEAIEYTYEFCREKITWAKNNKNFESVIQELKYGLAIVKNNVLDAKLHFEKTKKQKQQNQKVIRDIDTTKEVSKKIMEIQSTTKNKQRENKVDLSSLFD